MKSKFNIHTMALVAVMAAVICILGPLSLPIGIVPISLANLAIYFVLYILGMKRGTAACIIYILIGFVGIPVFAGFSSGPSILLGPTGGYLIGFVFMSIISGLFVDKFFDKWYLCVIGMLIGTAVCYAFGTVWLAHEAHLTVISALAAGVLPFIPGDVIKIVIATLIGPNLHRRLVKAKLLAA